MTLALPLSASQVSGSLTGFHPIMLLLIYRVQQVLPLLLLLPPAGDGQEVATPVAALAAAAAVEGRGGSHGNGGSNSNRELSSTMACSKRQCGPQSQLVSNGLHSFTCVKCRFTVPKKELASCWLFSPPSWKKSQDNLHTTLACWHACLNLCSGRPGSGL